MHRNEDIGSRVALVAVLVLIGACSLYALKSPAKGRAPLELSAEALLNVFGGR